MINRLKFKETIYGQFARVGKAIANPHRIELLDLLCQGPRTVEELAAESRMSLANTSQHLQYLRAGGLVESEKDGLYVTYQLAGEEVEKFYLALRQLAELYLAEVEKATRLFFQDDGSPEAVSWEALQSKIQSGKVVLIDVRPAEEYAAGHLPHAISMPLLELEKRILELPKRKHIVAYCRGPYCVFAREAVDLLRSHGRKAVRLREGVSEWRARGLALEGGSRVL